MEFVNFSIADRGIEIDGTTLDMHNAVLLRRVTHDLVAGRLELAFSGWIYMPPSGGGERGLYLDDEVLLVFEEVVFTRVQHRRVGDGDACLDHFGRLLDVGGPDLVTGLAAEDEGRDWSRTYYLAFTWSPEIVIEAARARAEWKRTTRAE